MLAKEDPTQKISDYVSELQLHGFYVKREFVRSIFKSWKWSWKKPSSKQLLKYTSINMEKYQNYVNWIAEQDLSKIKFMDEVHYVCKGLITYYLFNFF